MTDGKLYEAYVISLIARELVLKEDLKLTLSNGSRLSLKSSPGPINQSFPHILAFRGTQHVANIWSDTEFTSLSFFFHRSAPVPSAGEYHELDVLMSDPGADPRPRPDQVWLGVECKNTGYTKGLLKEILGIRRELSLLKESQPTRFGVWPRPVVTAEPPSCLLVYSTDPKVSAYASPGKVFGIDFFHAPFP